MCTVVYVCVCMCACLSVCEVVFLIVFLMFSAVVDFSLFGQHCQWFMISHFYLCMWFEVIVFAFHWSRKYDLTLCRYLLGDKCFFDFLSVFRCSRLRVLCYVFSMSRCRCTLFVLSFFDVRWILERTKKHQSFCYPVLFSCMLFIDCIHSSFLCWFTSFPSGDCLATVLSLVFFDLLRCPLICF